ncbi:POP1-domain-containing protein [Coniophora puteana RWD-64-598 SS2]|uniref:POP1-domain-containing protein n=1 Tax=Coniophora puteana (strain RWD-64-598) TaxID=741705 RepID=A0A5M3MQE2_CONPW|nr:POP1-domain-containing protein [Coniophora puteana RWD-64-598 SS2]EIW81399.1 POP1-domain-containing protein [Coniophora puteana RWD-64-598 SS2]
MQGLPSAIDVERFTEARAFEISAMQTAMQNASESSTTRVWQTLPRHLRRRAASHDVRRVPLRLRERARQEMDPVKRKALGRSQPKRGKGKQISRTESLLKRQRDKKWLETHLWHAKRMKMENMWGYRLAVHPNEKSYRSSHRASVHGSIIHDASYYNLIQLEGPETPLLSILENCCDPQGPSLKRGKSGSRTVDTHMYKHAAYPLDLIGPVTIIWKPLSTSPASSADLEESSKKQKQKQKGKQKQASNTVSSASTSSSPRIVWMWCHPAVYQDVFDALHKAGEHVVQAANARGIVEGAHWQVQISNISDSVNVFEIMGPKSSQVIKGALALAGDEDRDEFKKFWASLNDLQTTGSLARGMVAGFKVLDPRLKFPPKNAKPTAGANTSLGKDDPCFCFPTAKLAQSDIWDESARKSLKKPKYKKKDLDERRSKNLIPGTPLRALRQDDRVPLLLIQRSVQNPASIASASLPKSNSASGSISNLGLGGTSSRTSTSHAQEDSAGIHGWTLVIPAGWPMAFLSALTHTGTRVGAQRERATQAFEAGTPYFPRDYPCTGFYEQFASEREAKERAEWERKPPAKRVNFDKCGTRSAWRADWEVVLGLEAPKAQDNAWDKGKGQDLVPAQRDPPATAPTQPSSAVANTNPMKTWLLRGPQVPSLLRTLGDMLNPAAALLAELNALRLKRSLDPLEQQYTPLKAADLWASALVRVRLRVVGRGHPEEMGVLYKVEDRELVEALGRPEPPPPGKGPEAPTEGQEKGRGGDAEKAKAQSGGDEEEEDEYDKVEMDVDFGADEDGSDLQAKHHIPPQESIIGYVTTGNFSLTRGRGFAIGAVPARVYVELQRQAQRLKQPGPVALVRNRNGLVTRPVFLELLDA